MEKPYFLVYKVPVDEGKQDKDALLPDSKCLAIAICVFQTKLPLEDGRFCMAIVGSVPELGHWNRVGQTLATYREDGVWQARVELPVNIDIQYKWVVYEKRFCRIVEYEPGQNRRLRVNNSPMLIEDYYSGVQIVKELSASDVGLFDRSLRSAKVHERIHKEATKLKAINETACLTDIACGQTVYMNPCIESAYDLFAVDALHKDGIGFDVDTKTKVMELDAVYIPSTVGYDGAIKVSVIGFDVDTRVNVHVTGFNVDAKFNPLGFDVDTGYVRKSETDSKANVMDQNTIVGSITSDVDGGPAMIDVATQVCRGNVAENAVGVVDIIGDAINENVRAAVKVGIATGTAFSAILLYKKFF